MATRMLLAFCRSTPWFRGKGRMFQAIAAHGFGRALKVHNQHGARLRIDPADYIGRTISFDGGFEAKSLGLACAIMRGGGVFVDVGCNFGLYTLSVGMLPKVHCIAIDGSFSALARLKDNLSVNSEVDATLVNSALAAWPELQCFEVPDQQNLGSTRVSIDETLRNPSRFWAASLTLQHIMERLRPEGITLLKIDVEGAEMSVLQGLDFEGPYRPEHLLVECYSELFPHAIESFDFLAANGYDAMTIEGERLEEFRSVPEENVWFRSRMPRQGG